MSKYKAPFDLYSSSLEIRDPGNAATISVDRNPAVCNLVSATAETRTLARPTKSGIRVMLNMAVDGGDITLTVTGGFNEDGDTTFTFADPGQWAEFVSIRTSATVYEWRKVGDYSTANLTPTEAAALDGQVLATAPGAGFSGGTGTVYATTLRKIGNVKKMEILIDLTGLGSSTTDGDIIGVGASAAYFAQILAAEIGTVLQARLTCLEVPAGGADDIDLFYATAATGKFDDAISGLAGQTVLITAGGAWTANLQKLMAADIPANAYLYLCGGEAGTAATYTAGKFLFEAWGY